MGKKTYKVDLSVSGIKKLKKDNAISEDDEKHYKRNGNYNDRRHHCRDIIASEATFAYFLNTV